MNRFDNLKCLNTALNSGAFLSSGDNVMVASWGFIGVMWGKRVYVVPVRESRYTKTFMDESGVFTVSIPHPNEMKEEIKFCGTKSGREFEKWTTCGLDKVEAKRVDGYIVGGCQKYFECRIIGKLPMDNMDISEVEKWYPTGDLHTLYFGEIIEEY